jgi:4a-hydroxytetrahydrobiopterin dehydratase
MKIYTQEESGQKLLSLTGWVFKDNAIEKQFVFRNFKEAMAFMISVGEAAEEMNHHPEFYNVYNKVQLRLSTHDAGGVTDKDFDLAAMIEICAGNTNLTTRKSI